MTSSLGFVDTSTNIGDWGILNFESLFYSIFDLVMTFHADTFAAHCFSTFSEVGVVQHKRNPHSGYSAASIFIRTNPNLSLLNTKALMGSL